MRTKIMGSSQATTEKMRTYIKKINPKISQSVLDMIPLYLSEGEAEGVRGDIAFAQSCLETGNFTFKDSAVTLDQNNFCGMGVTKCGIKGIFFKTPQIGIRAQIQHLKAYACEERLRNTCVDPRFLYVTRGSATYVEWLGIKENPSGGGWASGKGYGEKILQILNNILKMEERNSEENMNIIKMITKKKCYVGQNKPEYIVIHETDNWSKGADAKAHATAMQNGNLAGTVHYYVDSQSIYQTLDHQDGAYAVGDGGGAYGITNRNSINIEICVNPESDYYEAVDKAQKLAAHLLNLCGFPIGRLVRHYDASRKHCPRRIMDEGKWDEFVNKTAVYMGMSAEEPDKFYRIRKSWTDSKSQIGAYKSLDNAKKDWKAGYIIFDWNGKAVYPEAATKEKENLTKAISVQFPEIRKGNTGSGVRVLQVVLNIEADGSFGDNTEKALKEFQKANKLTADGICGENTWKVVVKYLQENTYK